MDRWARPVLVALLVGFVAPAMAQFEHAGTFNYEYRGAIDFARNTQPLGDSPFGESVNLENGATTFANADIVARSNVKLPVRFGRSLEVRGDRGRHYQEDLSKRILALGWEADIPYMSGDFLEMYGWDGGEGKPRCSSGTFAREGAAPQGVLVTADNWFTGIEINIPGYGRERLLRLPPNAILPADGKTYVGTTRSNWRVSCLPSVRNGVGEGFLVTLPDGARYAFDWMATKSIGILTTPRGDWKRVEIRLYATRATDRFGGSVAYAFDAVNPHRITRITASDQASIQFAYDGNGRLSSASHHGRTWRYAYAVPGVATSGTYLSQVTLPDDSKWTYGNIRGVTTAHVDLPCKFKVGSRASHLPPEPHEVWRFTIKHPSGVSGEFHFRPIMFGYNRTPGQCASATSHRPKAYIAPALFFKQIAGPGLPTKAWEISYGPSWSYASECASGCTNSATTRVKEHDGRVTAHVFGNDFETNASQLLSVTVMDAAQGRHRHETYDYVATPSGQPFPDLVGLPFAESSPLMLLFQNRPLRATRIEQDGHVFIREHLAFDRFARPVLVKRRSESAGGTP